MLFPVLSILYFCSSTFQSMCSALPMAIFCTCLMSCFPGMLFRYFLNYRDIVPVAPVITGITFTLVMSQDQNAGQNWNIKIGNKLLETVEHFKYLGTTLNKS